MIALRLLAVLDTLASWWEKFHGAERFVRSAFCNTWHAHTLRSLYSEKC